MKRNRLLIFAVLLMIIASGVNAQYVISKSELPQQSRIRQQIYTPIEQNRQANNSRTKSGDCTGAYALWSGYNQMVQYVYNAESPNSVSLYAQQLINDTTTKLAGWDEEKSEVFYNKAWMLGAATVLDPNTEYFSNYYFADDYNPQYNAYKVDSVHIRGNYKRPKNTYTTPGGDVTIVDTLIIELVYGDTSKNNSFAKLWTNTTPVKYYAAPQWIKDNDAANGMGELYGYGYKVVKKLLTANDVTLNENSVYDPNTVKYYSVATNFQVPYGKFYVGVTYTFKSGIPREYLPAEPVFFSTTNAEDNGQVYQDMNSFTAAYYAHKDGNEIFHDPSSLSMNYSILKYHVGQSWTGNGSFYNNILFNVDDMGWDIIFDLTGDFCLGVSEVENVKVMNAYPNPVKRGNVAVVNLELANASNVSYGLYDITGKLISSENFGKISNGNKSFEINTNDLKSGIYFYTVTVEGNKINNKLMVIE